MIDRNDRNLAIAISLIATLAAIAMYIIARVLLTHPHPSEMFP